MIIIAAAENSLGMMFNNRRVTQDRLLWDAILELVNGEKLWMNEFSFKAFQDKENISNIVVDNDYPGKVPEGEYCFVEDRRMYRYEDSVEKIYLFRWNRDYPYDFAFDIKLQNPGWQLVKTGEFRGNSHDQITVEVYVNEKRLQK